MTWPRSQYYESLSDMCSLTQKSLCASAGGLAAAVNLFFLGFLFAAISDNPSPTPLLKGWGVIKLFWCLSERCQILLMTSSRLTPRGADEHVFWMR